MFIIFVFLPKKIAPSSASCFVGGEHCTLYMICKHDSHHRHIFAHITVLQLFWEGKPRAREVGSRNS